MAIYCFEEINPSDAACQGTKDFRAVSSTRERPSFHPKSTG